MATLIIIATKINEITRMKLMKKYSIGAFPNMTMFNQISDLDVRQHHINVDYKTFGCMNQEINNQTQMLNNFSKYFDVLLINEMMNQHNDTFRSNNNNNNYINNIDDANNSMMEMEKFNVLMFVDEKILLKMDIKNDEDLLKSTAYNNVAIDDINADDELKSEKILKIITVLSQQPTLVNMNIPLLKFGHILAIAGWCDIDIDGAVAIDSVLNDNDNKINYDNIYLMKQTMMAILHIVLNDNDKRIIQNSNNKKLTNNCKIEINTENINFSYYCDEYYEIIFNVSVFLSQKFDIMQIINKNIMNSSIMRMFVMENKLQSHIQSFIVTDENDDDDDNDGKIMKIIIIRLSNEKSSISSQSNTNKSEYAFEKTLNNDKKFYVVANDKDKIFSLKSMTMMESTSKLFLSSNFFSFFMQLLYPMMVKNKSFIQSYIRNYFYDDDKDDAGYIKMISKNVEMQLNCQKSLQSYKESDQQSGIVSNISYNNIKLVNDDGANDKHIEPVEVMIMMEVAAAAEATVVADNNAAIQMPDADDYDRMNISELLFSHINDKNETLIDNTVNITCDFNYLNYNIISNTDNDKNNNNNNNNYKINDQIRKDNDETRFKDTTNYNNNNEYDEHTMMTIRKSANEITTEQKTNGNATTSKYQAMTQIDMLIECQQREKSLIKQYEAMGGRKMRLCGGAGDSLSGASGWGSPPSNTSTSNNPNAGQWGAASQQQAPQQSWNQAAQQQASGGQASVQPPSQQVPQQQNPPVGQAPQAGAQGQKPLTPSGGWNQPPNPNQVGQPPQVQPGNGGGIVGGGTSAVAAKNQLEQLNSMREALFSQDGWGCQNVNQDTNWDVPGSPEPGPRGDPSASAGGATQWKSHTINNGTELWEANLRNGGQPPPQPVQKTPWNHTPTTNIGGTWGEEDDDNTENTNVWNAGQNNQPAPGWNQNQSTSATNSGTMWPAAQGVGSGVNNVNVPKKDDWGANAVGGGNSSNWDPRGPAAASNQMDIRNIDPRAPGTLDMRMMDARDQMQGNLRGVTGRLNGATSEMWQQGGMQGMPGINKTVGPNAGAASSGNNPQWPGMQGPKDLEINKPSGWDSSPPASRRPLGGSNFDDGTSLWGQSRVPGGGGVQDPMARNNFGRNPIGGGAAPTGIPPNRLPGAGMKPGEANTWGSLHPGAGNRNTWDDPHTPNWDDKAAHLGAGGIGTPWNEGPNAGPLWNKNKPSWPDSSDINSDWPQANKLSNTSSEIIRSSKQFRILAESGFKKDDAELALRTTNMNVEEAMELLQQQQRNANIEPWHHNTAPGTFDHSPFPGNRYPGPKMPFPPNNNPQMPNSNTGPGANIGLNNLPMQFNKHLPHQGGVAPTAFSQQAVSASQSGQPSAHHLRNLVQQIQKAVQAGYLNHQILNQPLAPQTLQLLNSLLNAIQQLQMTQQSIQRNGGVNSIQLQMTIQKQKQQISTLQSQIAQQQALYIKSQAGGGGGGGIGSGNDFLRQNSSGNMGMGVGNHNDPIASLETNLSNLGLKQDPTPYTSNTTSQQSRLNQWIKDNKSTDPDFSRAPGTTSSKQSLPPTTPTSISSIGLHNEPSTWSSGRNDGGWPDSSIDSENKDWPSSNQSPAFTDLVPEFQPGKPWKGTQKNIEDDPSITPGSVARNPLSIGATKDSELFASNAAKTSPNEILSSSTWSFNPSTTTQQNFNSTMSKLGGADTKTNSWSDSTSDLWAAPTLGKTTAGPPPGLGAGNAKNGGATAATSESNDWMGGWNATNSSNSSNGQWYSTWLLLKNLTAQIDGSTLRTLCVQHGPLQHFHLYLNHGIALCKYNTREEASKAQQALNNCVLSNTTICAESPSESEVQNILSHLGVPSNNGNGNGSGSTAVGAGQNASTWRPNSQQGRAGSDTTSTWGSDWPPSNSAINW